MNKTPLASIHKLKSALPLITALLCLTTLTTFSQKPEIYVSTGHAQNVASLAFSPDGKTLASSDTVSIRLWDCESGQELATLRGSENGMRSRSVAFSPDGKTLVGSDGNATIRFWDVESGHEYKTINADAGPVVFSPDGKMLAGGSWAGTVKVWDVLTGAELRTLKGHSQAVSSIAFSPDGRILASGSRDRAIILWEMASGRKLKTLNGHMGDVMSVATSPDGKILASGGRDALKLWDMISGREINTRKPLGRMISYVSFSPNGQSLAILGAFPVGAFGIEYSIRIRDVASGVDLQSFKNSATFSARIFAFSPDGNTLASGGRREIKLWDSTSGQELRTLAGRSGSVTSVAFSPDGKAVAQANSDDTINLWDLASGRMRPWPSPSGSVNRVAFSANGKILASVASSEFIGLWDVASEQQMKALKVGEPISSMAISPDSQRIVSGGWTGTIKLYDIASGQLVLKINAHTDWVTSVLFVAGGRTLISSSRGDGTIKVWDLSSGNEVSSFKRSSTNTNSTGEVALSPDGRTLALADGEFIRLLDVPSGLELRVLKGYSEGIWSLIFSADGKTLSSGDFGGVIRIWQVETGDQIRTLVGHTGYVTSIRFSPDGRTLVSGCGDATTKLWDVSSEKNIASMIALDKSDWVTLTPDGRFDGSAEGMKRISYRQDNKLLPLDSFFDQFFTPNLLQRVFAREEMPPTPPRVDFSKRVKLPPVVRIISPKPGSESSTDTAQITVEANDQGGGVEDIRLYQNGKRLGDDVTRQLVQDKKGNTRTFEVDLLPGINTFRATAFNSDRTEAVPDEIKIELKAVEASANLYILAVGLNEYKNARYNLNYGNADARAFADAVEKKGKNIFKEIKKKVIFDADASHAGIKAEFEHIIKNARPQDVFVFFWAGHGAMSEGDAKKAADFYLVPYDVVSISGESGNLEKMGIAATELREMSRKIKALKQLIVIDACQSGGAVETIAMMRGPAEEKAIQQLARSAGVAVLASAGQNQVATEFSKLGHGVFTYALLKGLNGEADGSPMDGKVTVSELRAYLDDQVPELTKLHRGKSQYPNSFSRGQDFPIGIK